MRVIAEQGRRRGRQCAVGGVADQWQWQDTRVRAEHVAYHSTPPPHTLANTQLSHKLKHTHHNPHTHHSHHTPTLPTYAGV